MSFFNYRGIIYGCHRIYYVLYDFFLLNLKEVEKYEKNEYIYYLPFLFLVLVVPTTVPKQKSNLTVGMIKTKVVKGNTSQNEILNTFGAPNLVTKNRSNDEVWSYNKMSSESAGKSQNLFLLLYASNSAISSSTTSSFDFIITFDENDIVKDYSIISSSY